MKPTIALFLHQPRASVQCGNAMIAALDQYYRIKIFTRHDIEKDFFNNVDIVAFPGGEGDSESYHYLMKHHAPRIRNYVAQGGRYLGICMGAYWAGSHYFDILDDVDAVQYITRPGTDTRRPHAKACAVNWQGEPMKMYFYDGCALVGDRRKFETVATYANGDAMAIYQDRMGLIGCHPESEQYWYNMHNYMRPHYHMGYHHQLLLDFTNELMKR
jgi:hypothetical protein